MGLRGRERGLCEGKKEMFDGMRGEMGDWGGGGDIY